MPRRKSTVGFKVTVFGIVELSTKKLIHVGIDEDEVVETVVGEGDPGEMMLVKGIMKIEKEIEVLG